jgi:predicted RNA-binding Zn-ribbon protein involved in translation (DUF1610 family)
MPVKVVSEGPTASKQVTCSKCTYKLEYTGEDVQTSSGYSMGEHDVSFYIVCPRCGANTSVPAWSLREGRSWY